MTGYFSYQMFQAERPRSRAQVREADMLLGELAAAMLRATRAVSRGGSGLRGRSGRKKPGQSPPEVGPDGADGVGLAP